jgi:dTDP-4-dehydrorhamnose 3,5-epimerase
MKLLKTDFKDLIIIKHKLFNDKRGFFKEDFSVKKLGDFIGKKIIFCQQNSVKSNLNVLRGLHYQKEPFGQSKLISISSGRILDIAVDIRKNSKTYGKYFSHMLDCDNHESIFIPKGFAHGYLTLSKIALVHYQVDNYYNPKMESGIPFDDSLLNIDWGIKKSKLIISKKDSNHNPFIW